jgi:hypothetical protein
MKWLTEFLAETDRREGAESDKRARMSPALENIAQISPEMAGCPSAKSAKSPDAGLQNRLQKDGIHLAIDKETGEGCLIFRDDVERVQQAGCATFVSLDRVPEDERQEVIRTVQYYEGLLERRKS